jgi:hypothetical protein
MLSEAALSHKKTESASTSRDSCITQDSDERNTLCLSLNVSVSHIEEQTERNRGLHVCQFNYNLCYLQHQLTFHGEMVR